MMTQIMLKIGLFSSSLLTQLETRGIGQPLAPEQMSSGKYQILMTESEKQATDLNMECQAVQYETLSIKKKLKGYRSTVLCDDAPGPGVALYFDVKQVYLGMRSLGD